MVQLARIQHDRRMRPGRVAANVSEEGFCSCQKPFDASNINACIFQKIKKEQLGAHLDDQKRHIPPEWLDWAEINMKRGVRGDVVLSTLVKAGFRQKEILT